METKEILAILAAVVAVCLIIAIGQTIRGPEESSEAPASTSQTTVTSQTNDIWNTSSETSTTTAYFSQTAESVSDSLIVFSTAGSDISGISEISTTSTVSSFTTFSTTSSVTTSVTTSQTSAETYPDTFVIVQ